MEAQKKPFIQGSALFRRREMRQHIPPPARHAASAPAPAQMQTPVATVIPPTPPRMRQSADPAPTAYAVETETRERLGEIFTPPFYCFLCLLPRVGRRRFSNIQYLFVL